VVKKKKLQQEIDSTFATLRKQLDNRQAALTKELKGIVAEKNKILQSQSSDSTFALNNLSHACDTTKKLLQKGNDVEILMSKTLLMTRLKQVKEVQLESLPKTTEAMTFIYDISRIQQEISALGFVADESIDVANCEADGKGLTSAKCDQEATFRVITKTKDQKQLKAGGQILAVTLTDTKRGDLLSKVAQVADHKDGTYTVTYHPKKDVAGDGNLNVMIKGVQILRSPFSIQIQSAGKAWTWDPIKKGTELMTSGDHYWEVTFDSGTSLHIMVGVAIPEIQYNQINRYNTAETRCVYVYSGGFSSHYGALGTPGSLSTTPPWKAGDVVGMLLSENKNNSSFDLFMFHNRQKLGQVGSNIPLRVHAFCELDTANDPTITLNTNVTKP